MSFNNSFTLGSSMPTIGVGSSMSTIPSMIRDNAGNVSFGTVDNMGKVTSSSGLQIGSLDINSSSKSGPIYDISGNKIGKIE